VVVVVVAVCCVPMAVMHIIDVVTVWHRDMATVRAVDVFVRVMGDVLAWLALVEVTVVSPVQVAVVDVVGVAAVRHSDVSAAVAVDVFVVDVFAMGGRHDVLVSGDHGTCSAVRSNRHASPCFGLFPDHVEQIRGELCQAVHRAVGVGVQHDRVGVRGVPGERTTGGVGAYRVWPFADHGAVWPVWPLR
jgi:hypothetical protein